MKLVLLSLGIAVVFMLACLPAVAQPWNLRIVDDAGNMGYNSRIAVTSDGTPYILYVDDISMTYEDMTYLAWWVPTGPETGGWDRVHVGFGFRYYYCTTALISDAHDNLHLSWCDFSWSYPDPYNAKLKYAVLDAGTKSWLIPPETILERQCYPAIGVIDTGGTHTPIIAYVEDSSRDLYCTTRDSTTGTWSLPDTIYTGSIGTKISMAVGSTGQIYICFYEETGDDLMYATKAPNESIWAWGYIDVTNNVGMYNSIIMDENDIPHVVYYDATNKDLKYAKVISN